ncbi:retrovirus-related Pol polyprotein from transposon 412 [Trichonephila clavipes]|nr:retrovirus-related Pol polyprotein from transposon 412 [Trichonephila clavipes]
MMAFLLKQTKEVLLEVAIDLGVEVNSTLTKSEIKNRICQSEDYDEESVKSLLEGILAEKRETKESERETREFEERKLIRAFEWERMKLANSADTISVSSTDLEGQGVNRRVNLRDLVSKFDAKNADINLFFEIFERQAKKEKVAEDRWVSQLIPLLPMEIAEIVAKEPLEKSDDYPRIKNLLLARFQLTPIALRDRFESHQRRPGTMWADLVFELRSYLDNWQAGMKRRGGVRHKTCDSCQRVGKLRDKAKAPLKLMPIISEVFSKINIGAVRPLPVSTNRNRYLITSICVASKYPEAISVESITSPNVIDALLSIFSRIGFPREIQSDLGTSFTSELTTTFFNKFGIKVTRSSVSHPKSNAVERVHRTSSA